MPVAEAVRQGKSKWSSALYQTVNVYTYDKKIEFRDGGGLLHPLPHPCWPRHCINISDAKL